jgi:arylsulfatase
MLFEVDEPKPGSGGKVTLYANDEQIGEGTLPKAVPLAFSSYSGMDVGRDNGLVVDLEYEDEAPYAFTGTVKRVVFDLKPASHEHELALHQVAQHANLAHGAAG